MQPEKRSNSESILEVKGLKKYFPVSRKHTVKAVDDVSFEVYEGETLGVVGESGCGKSTMGRAILYLQPPTAGQVTFNGKDLSTLKGRERRKLRKEMQMVFQDPYGSLNPRMTVGAMLGEIVRTHRIVPKHEVANYVRELLVDVGMKPEHADRYPHEFSGGQRQRISIARALAVQPKLIVCDEAVSALDVSVQAQILNLLRKLKQERHLTYLFISHDLSVVKHISDRVIVMYLGKIVEMANKHDLYAQPRHPYTQALLSAIPKMGEEKRERIILKGDVPSPLAVPSGCPFHTRCPIAQKVCAERKPEWHKVGDGHYVACHFA
ncbi:ABC transporter ATP-binding protein [Caenibacillus caldisaponilyticus]|uniref:ABC transporter ATP-binding protein n=1 Tax=Caenibacillus caldisaponilyticus TaxID=1674942 RepID=UPI0009886877|nr:dipeptide ABC transporter ATP-binding protein [Caenibacillus caldisaponilyticus]